jgi:hypothetical protein
MTTTHRLVAAAASIAITAGLLQAVFAIAATAPDSQVVREAVARQSRPTLLAGHAASTPLPQFANATRFIR